MYFRSWLGHTNRPGLVSSSLAEARVRLFGENTTTEALMGLLLRNGLRVSEAIGLDVTDLDTRHGHRIPRMVGKGAKAAVVVLAPTIEHALDLYLDQQLPGSACTASPARIPWSDGWRDVRGQWSDGAAGSWASPSGLAMTTV